VTTAATSAAPSADDAFAYAAALPDVVVGKKITKELRRYSDPAVLDPNDPNVPPMVARFGRTLDDMTSVQGRDEKGLLVFELVRLKGVDAAMWTKVLDDAAIAEGGPSPQPTTTSDGRDVKVYTVADPTAPTGATVIYQYTQGDVLYRAIGATADEAERVLSELL